MANLVIGKMKLLAAGPPLLFLALLYSLFFIDLSFSGLPGEVKPSLSEAVTVLERSDIIKLRLANVVTLLYNLKNAPMSEVKPSPKLYINANEFQQQLQAYSLKFVKAEMGIYLQQFVSSVVYSSLNITVNLADGAEKMIYTYPFMTAQCVTDRWTKVDIFHNRLHYFQSADSVLQFIHSLGDEPKILIESFKYPQWNRSCFKFDEVSDKNMLFSLYNQVEVVLQRQGVVTIWDDNNEEVLKFRNDVTRMYSEREISVIEGFTKGCIWADLMKERMGDIWTIKRKTLERGGVIDLVDYLPFKGNVGSTQRVTSSFTSSERTDDGSVKIGITTKFHAWATAEGETDVPPDVDVLHYHTFSVAHQP
eukprot:GHVS01072713.1.p1 GENE.GHVS01072713.1~~GHVS01072713.1.p1  ORF type:complete len:364 (+),score=27.47 GHVS01072713.1:115-1206(+)